MKKCNLVLTVILILSFMASPIIAAEKNNSKDTKRPQSQKRTVRPKKPDARSNSRQKMNLRARNREMMLQKQTERMQAEIDKQKKVHEKYINQLKAIKEMAKKEDAPKTAELISDLIAKENEKFEKATEVFKKRIKGFKARTRKGFPRNDAPKRVRPSDDDKKSSPKDAKKSEKSKDSKK